jgi:hypothetical protein
MTSKKAFESFLISPKSIAWIIVINLIVRVALIPFTCLGIDEVYYTLYALYPDFSYFDHPPMVGLLIRLSTFNLAFIFNDFFVRLGSIVIGSLNIYLIFRIGTLLKDKAAGLIAALIISSSFYCSVIIGIFIIPDTPLSIFWLLSLFLFLKHISGDEKTKHFLYAFGVAVGFALLSKYQAIFLWFGAIIYFLVYDRKALLKAKFWFSGLISILIFSPVIWWNFTSKYSGLNYHAGRVGNSSWIPSLKFFFREFFGQIFYVNPFSFVLIVLSLIYIFKKGLRHTDPKISFLLSVSLPLIIVTISMSLYNQTLPHWSGPSYFALILITGYVFSTEEMITKKILRIMLICAQILFFLTMAVSLFEIKTDTFMSLINKDSEKVGVNNLIVDISSWEEIAMKLDLKITEDRAVDFTPKNYVILSHNWFPGSHLDYYYAMPNKINLYVLGESVRQHQYMKINKERGLVPLHSDAYYISTSNYFSSPQPELISRFEKAEGPQVISVPDTLQKRVDLFIWKMTNLKNNVNLTTATDRVQSAKEN